VKRLQSVPLSLLMVGNPAGVCLTQRQMHIWLQSNCSVKDQRSESLLSEASRVFWFSWDAFSVATIGQFVLLLGWGGGGGGGSGFEVFSGTASGLVDNTF